MKPKVYLETTIPSLLTAWPSRDLIIAADQQVTRTWWEQQRGKYQLVVSTLVLDEVQKGDPAAAAKRLASLSECQILAMDEAVIKLGEAIMRTRLIFPRALTTTRSTSRWRPGMALNSC